MGVDTKRYIRKPLYVDAVRVTPKNFEDVAAWCSGEIHKETEGPRAGKSYIRVRVQYPKSPRQSKAFVGDWVLYTETGYKVYTNPAFVKSFDAVEYTTEEIEEKLKPHMPHHEGHGAATGADPEFEGTPGVATPPEPIEEIESVAPAEEAPGETDTGGFELEPPPVETAVDEHTTPQGEPHEYVEATPEAIADVVNEQQPVTPVGEEGAAVEESPTSPPVAEEPRLQTETGPDHKLRHEPVGQAAPVSHQPPAQAAAGKHVLSEEEQRQMGPDKVREMLAQGDVILAQDLAAESA